jgi:hypothetical protein
MAIQGVGLVLPTHEGVNLSYPRQVRGVQAADGATTDNADAWDSY